MLLELTDSGNIVLYEHKKEKPLMIGEHPKPEQLETLNICTAGKHYEPILESGLYLFDLEDTGLYRALLTQDNLTHIQYLGDDRSASTNPNGNGRKLILTSPNNKQLSQMHSWTRLVEALHAALELERIEEPARG